MGTLTRDIVVTQVETQFRTPSIVFATHVVSFKENHQNCKLVQKWKATKLKGFVQSNLQFLFFSNDSTTKREPICFLSLDCFWLFFKIIHESKRVFDLLKLTFLCIKHFYVVYVTANICSHCDDIAAVFKGSHEWTISHSTVRIKNINTLSMREDCRKTQASITWSLIYGCTLLEEASHTRVYLQQTGPLYHSTNINRELSFKHHRVNHHNFHYANISNSCPLKHPQCVSYTLLFVLLFWQFLPSSSQQSLGRWLTNHT